MLDPLHQAVASQKQAFLRNAPPGAALRRDRLARLDGLLAGNIDALIDAVNGDFGNRARAETIVAELLPVRDAIAMARRSLRGWMRPRRARVGARLWPGSAWTRCEPLGCIGIVSPWNYPILLSLMPAIDALAAGNRVMLKPSERSPACSALLQRLVAATFEADEFLVVTGDEAVGSAFCALPFDHLLFTGSTEIGRKVARAAAAGLVPVTLELGGKSPVILCDDAVAAAATLARTAHSVAVGKFFNAGQTCLAPDYVLTPRARLAETATALLQAAARLYPTLPSNPDYTALISTAHYLRQQALVDEAIPGSLAVLRHPEDRPDRQPELRSARKFPPTVLCAPQPESRVMREEIFGPVLPVLGYDTIEQAIAFINARPAPLALYCYSHDAALQRRILSRTRSGGVTLNGTLLHGAMPSLGFGGIGESGMGSYHGHAGFLRFSHQRAVYRTGFFSGFTWLSPPHGKLSKHVLALMLAAKR